MGVCKKKNIAFYYTQMTMMMPQMTQREQMIVVGMLVVLMAYMYLQRRHSMGAMHHDQKSTGNILGSGMMGVGGILGSSVLAGLAGPALAVPLSAAAAAAWVTGSALNIAGAVEDGIKAAKQH